MPYHLKSSGSLLLTAFVVALGLASAACEDESAAVSGGGGGGNAGEASGDLEATSSMGGTANDGGTGGSATGGAATGGTATGGTANASDGSGGGGSSGGGSNSTSDGPASGGTGGMELRSGGSGGSAGAPGDECEDDPRCASFTPGSFCVGSFSTTCEDEDADGCLDFSQHSCAPAGCENGDCVPGNEGEACDDAIDVVASGFTWAGADFGADFADDLELVGNSCELPDPAAPDVMFRVVLEAGQVLSVVERGDLDAVVHVQAACGAEDCLAATDDVEDEPFEYTATVDETVFVVVEAYDEVPNPAWYRLHVDIDPECGNGILEASEDCDVGDPAVSPGCSEECSVEFGYECGETSPSLCTAIESLGEFDAAYSIAPIVSQDRFEVWDEDYWLVTFSENVVLDLEAHSLLQGTGDVHVEILNEAGQVALYRNTGDEVDQLVGLAAGTYVIRVFAETPLPDGYGIDLLLRDPGECGDGEVEPALEQCDTAGEPGCTEACTIEFDHLCQGTSPSMCTPIDPLGVLGPNETSGAVPVPDAIAGGESSYRVFSLSEETLLSVSVEANNAVGDPDVWIYTATGAYYPWENIGDESFTWLFPAGDYKIQVYAHHALDDGYTLTLTTAVP